MLPRPAWAACMQEAVARTGIDKKKTLGDGGKGHRSSAPSVTPTPSRSKPTARPVLHKRFPPAETYAYPLRQGGQLAAFSRALANWRARATSCQIAACEAAKACRELYGARILPQFTCWLLLYRKKQLSFRRKNATEKTGNSRFRYRKESALISKD